MSIPRDQIDPDAERIVKRLVRHKHQAYLVGGCVRDLLIGRTPKDFDIATSATPSEIKELFRNCRIIGRRFRLAHIFFGSKIIETSTFRANPREVEAEAAAEEGVEPDDGPADLLIRRDNVFGTAEEDARRRDFTMNGLFYDVEADQVIDYVNGLPDIQSRTVRTIGDPDVRFREDPVRILRAIKFSARLGFTIEPEAWQAILTHKGEIPKCAAPRVLEEIYRVLRGGAGRRSLELLREAGVLELLVVELADLLSPTGDLEAQERLWRVLEQIDVRPPSRAPTNAVLLCALLGPFLGRAILDDNDRTDVGALFDERVRPVLVRMRVSRRDAERARMMMLTLRRLWPSKRRRKASALTRRDFFDEALDVFELLGNATVEGTLIADEVERWKRLARETGHEPPAHHEAPHHETPPPRAHERSREREAPREYDPSRDALARQRPPAATMEDPITGLPVVMEDAPRALDAPALAVESEPRKKRRRRRGGRRHKGEGEAEGTLAAEPGSTT